MLNIFTDASYDTLSDSKSATGYCFRLGKIPILWKTKKQNRVTHSSCEAEIEAMCHAIKDLQPIQLLLSEIAPNTIKYPIVLHTDSQSGIDLVSNGGSADSKHFLRRVNAVRDEVVKSNIQLLFTPSEIQLADMFTKLISGVKLKNICEQELNLY